MDTPDYSGEVLRAIAKAYRDEMGPARAEQLAARAVARSGAQRSLVRRIGLLAPSLALAASVVVAGVVVLTSDSDPLPPVVSAPVPEVTAPEGTQTTIVPTLTREGLMEALDLIDRQQPVAAAEVVFEALSYIAKSVTTKAPSVSPTPLPEERRTPTTFSSVGGELSPEPGTQPGQGTDPASGPPSETGVVAVEPPEDVTSDNQPSIEELGQVLKIEVEELLAVINVPESDPNALPEAVEEVENAIFPILEYESEPTIIFPTADEDESGEEGSG